MTPGQRAELTLEEHAVRVSYMRAHRKAAGDRLDHLA
jgi:hypothetical protein